MFTALTQCYETSLRLVRALRKLSIDAHVLDVSLGLEGVVINPETKSQTEDASRICRRHETRMHAVDL